MIPNTDSRTGSPAAMLPVSLFAGLAAAAGVRRLDLVWVGGTAADLKAAVAALVPVAAALVAKSAVAVDGAFIADAARLPTGVDVAIIPPVSGG